MMRQERLRSMSSEDGRRRIRIFGLLPEDQGRLMLRALWEEFEAYETPEARFAHTMDNFQPMLLNDSNGGGDWKEPGASKRSQTEKRNEKDRNRFQGDLGIYENIAGRQRGKRQSEG